MYYSIAPTSAVNPSRTKLVLPAFEYEVTWDGISGMLARYLLNNEEYLSIIPLAEPADPSFLLAVSWQEDDVTYRYKFWAGGSLYYSVYNGERISPGAQLEVWSIADTPAILSADLTLYTSLLNPVLQDCSGAQGTILDVSTTLVPDTELD